MPEKTILSRDLSPKDCAQFPNLLEKVWKRKSTEDYWQWKFVRYPFHKKAIVFENRYGDILGLNAFWLRPTKLGETVFSPWMAIDVMADPKFRGAGIAQDIIRIFVSELDKKETIFGFTNPISYNMFSTYLKEYIIIESHIPVMIAVINAGAYINTAKIIKSLISGVSRSIHKISLRFVSYRNLVVQQCDEIGEEFDELWNNVSDDYFWIQNRGKDYLRWRYISAPHREYQVWTALERGKLVGYLVTTIKNDSKISRGFLVDWLVSRNRPDIFKAMVKSALDWLINQRVDVVETLLLDHEKVWNKILKTHFFSKIKRTQSFLMASPDELKVDDLFLTLGDSDQI